MEVSMSITRRGKYTDSNICMNVQVCDVACLFFLLYANLLVLVTLCEGNHYPFIEERYTFLHELQRVPYTFLHELSAQTYTFLHELSSYYVHDNRFPILFIMIDCLHIFPQFLIERMLRHRVLVNQSLRISI